MDWLCLLGAVCAAERHQIHKARHSAIGCEPASPHHPSAAAGGQWRRRRSAVGCTVCCGHRRRAGAACAVRRTAHQSSCAQTTTTTTDVHSAARQLNERSGPVVASAGRLCAAVGSAAAECGHTRRCAFGVFRGRQWHWHSAGSAHFSVHAVRAGRTQRGAVRAVRCCALLCAAALFLLLHAHTRTHHKRIEKAVAEAIHFCG